jgi:hypothetical protein
VGGKNIRKKIERIARQIREAARELEGNEILKMAQRARKLCLKN